MANEINTIHVEGMSCSHCENAVKKALGALNGVVGVIVSLPDKTVTVEYDSTKVSLDTITDTIEGQGYDVK